ncbi:MAG: SEC-C domain-containing protein [Acidobacteria bacterium]|nr:SEC-C domain-containing protein [Acidobacteriota bacterium]
MASPGRNAPCPCGTGRKFKHCCLRAQDEEVPSFLASQLVVEVNSARRRRRIEKEIARHLAFGDALPSRYQSNEIAQTEDFRRLPTRDARWTSGANREWQRLSASRICLRICTQRDASLFTDADPFATTVVATGASDRAARRRPS